MTEVSAAAQLRARFAGEAATRPFALGFGPALRLTDVELFACSRAGSRSPPRSASNPLLGEDPQR
jgi:hypothetical protein